MGKNTLSSGRAIGMGLGVLVAVGLRSGVEDGVQVGAGVFVMVGIGVGVFVTMRIGPGVESLESQEFTLNFETNVSPLYVPPA